MRGGKTCSEIGSFERLDSPRSIALHHDRSGAAFARSLLVLLVHARHAVHDLSEWRQAQISFTRVAEPAQPGLAMLVRCAAIWRRARAYAYCGRFWATILKSD